MALDRRALAQGALAYLVWGSLPLYWHTLAPTPPAMLLAHRIVWSALVGLVLLGATRRLRELAVPRAQVPALLAATAAVTVNWGVYVLAVSTHRVVESSLGYFIGPLVTVALAVAVRGEVLLPGHRWALAAAGLGVAVVTVDLGSLPWISLVLACSWSFYGLCKSSVPGSAVASVTRETLILVPLMGWWLVPPTGSSAAPMWLLATTGVATIAPMILFSAAAPRIPLSVSGVLQYINPTMQLLIGVIALGERVGPLRWAGFACVWVGAGAFLLTSARRGREAHAA